MLNFMMRKRSLSQGNEDVATASKQVGSITHASFEPSNADQSRKTSQAIRATESRSTTSSLKVRLFGNVHDNEACIRKNRKLISKYVGKIGRHAGLQLSLDSYGFCYIPFRRFLIMIEVPEDEPHQVFFHTMIFDLPRSKIDTRARKAVTAMQRREVSLGKFGSTITTDQDEVFLCYSRPIKGLSYSEMLECLEDFMATALRTNSDLDVLSTI